MKENRLINIVVGRNTFQLESYLRDKTKAGYKTLSFPEIKKHPAYLAKYLDDFISHLQEDCFIITHSEALINYIGTLIYKGKVNCEDVQIIMIKDDGSEKQFLYNIDGFLKDWALGFFYPDIEKRI